jgi:hypothetical protein
MAVPWMIPRSQVLQVLRRVGYSEERIDEIKAELGDPVDLEDETLLSRYGLTRDRLMDLMGGSP